MYLVSISISNTRCLRNSLFLVVELSIALSRDRVERSAAISAWQERSRLISSVSSNAKY